MLDCFARRNQNQISNGARGDPLVYACWLEGADSDNTVEETALREVEAALSKLDHLDYNYEKAMADHSKLRHRIYHLEGTPETLILDVVVQSYSKDFEFIRQNEAEQPRVIFDKAEAINFRDADETQLEQTLRERTPFEQCICGAVSEDQAR